jgi:peptidylprolyl isomerase
MLSSPYLTRALLALALLAACGAPPAAPNAPVPEAVIPPAAPAVPENDPPDEPEARRPADPLATPRDVAAPPPDAQRTPSGLAFKVLRKGHGDRHPGPTDQVTVHYTGWTTDGKMFDSSYKRGTPLTLGLNQVIKGWTEGVQLMVVGEKRRFWIPPDLAYGATPRPGMPTGMLVFDVELLEVR